MEQMRIDPSLIVEADLRGSASLLKPTLFKEEDSYFCVLGPDSNSAVVGIGDTPEEAIEDWDDTLKARLELSSPNDPIVAYVKEVISNQPKPNYLQEFYDQFRPGKKG